MFLGMPGLGIGRTMQGGAGAPPDPLAIFGSGGTGVLLWLRAHVGLDLALTGQWTDQSGQGNHVQKVGTPTLAAGAIGGKDAVNLAGGAYFENTLSNLVAANSAYSVFAVAKNGNGCLLSIRRTPAYSGSIFFFANPTFYVHGDGVNVSANITTASATAETQSAVNAFYSCHRYLGGANNPNIFLNGTQRAITSVGTMQSTETGSTGFMVGNTGPGQVWNGLIAELIVVGHSVSVANRQAVETYQKFTYPGLP